MSFSLGCVQDWILKSERIRKWILCFFTKQINSRSFGSRCIRGFEESSLEVDSSVPLTHPDQRYLGLICLVKKRKIHFQILLDLRIQSWIFLKKRTLNFIFGCKWWKMHQKMFQFCKMFCGGMPPDQEPINPQTP